MHLFNEESLKVCFNALDGKKAVGIDGVDKAAYKEHLDENLKNLMSRMKRMAYRPGPVRQVRIPKEGKPGAMRPLGISNLEDKIVHKMTQKVLESIYEPIFLECSYGFRPARGAHDALKALHRHLYRHEVQTVIDVDLANFFGTIDHKLLENIVRKKIQDERFIRYLIRMFKAGVLADSDLTISDEGVPQGSSCSPVLANVFAHYVIDEWFERTVKRHCAGKVELFRYCDDAVICCQSQYDAKRIERALGQRLAKYGLKLNKEKTKLVSFSKREARQGIKQGAFDFLGFTIYWGRSRKGHAIPKVKTNGRRLRAKLKRVKAWAISVKNRLKLKEIWKRFCIKLRGHIRYYGVSFNLAGIRRFHRAAIQILFKWLNRRSQRKSFDWDKFNLFMKLYPPPRTKIYHPLI
jgi:group II intron reverse transcriptase/maturase